MIHFGNERHHKFQENNTTLNKNLLNLYRQLGKLSSDSWVEDASHMEYFSQVIQFHFERNNKNFQHEIVEKFWETMRDVPALKWMRVSTRLKQEREYYSISLELEMFRWKENFENKTENKTSRNSSTHLINNLIRKEIIITYYHIIDVILHRLRHGMKGYPINI